MNWKAPEVIALVNSLLSLKTGSEMRAFLRDLMTEGEIQDFSKRLETASLLAAGITYPVISKKTGFSTTTIARVSKWLQTGKGGYDLVLSRAHSHSPISGERGLR